MPGMLTEKPGPTLPIIPPIEDDELISSWLDRIAYFYGEPSASALLTSRLARTVELSDIDLGTPRASLRPVATLLGVSDAHLASKTITMGYPWAAGLVARGTFVPEGQRRPRLRYAACPHCLEQQRVERGFSWLRRDWVLGPRTVCPLHQVMLIEGTVGAIAHPIWSEFLGRHQRSDDRICAAAHNGRMGVSPLSFEREQGWITEFHRHVVDIQASILAEAERKPRNRRPVVGEGRGLIAADLIWAFTRADRDYSDRLVYEEVSSELLDNRWHMVRRRRSGPVDFVNLPIVERHILVATAAVLVGPEEWLRRFYPFWAPGKIAIGMLEKCLNDADRAEFVERRQNWPRDRTLGLPAEPVNYPG